MGLGPPSTPGFDAGLAPYVSDETTWRERRALYEELFAKPDTFLLLATDGVTLVGYALVHMIAATDTWTGDTWVTGETIAELEIDRRRARSSRRRHRHEAPRRRRRRTGTPRHPRLIVGALPGNEGVLRLYERRGFRPTWLYLSRFQGR